ncbi:hypothetical protein B0T26DRAFT_687644 [Lasiosphaeria miniovina]|uniref:Uncharacterized protein n=1 Tax=Lasiosphaeria miniovina TaxID=1954250 RepID=A0AA40BH85_9PEZI|nr:uncharacterized protein B0T26DRAFT_687644 [Lasiosphaeria miniovina]KAK0734202.1 hypothetical protein B0T26DRAFT_687644 [Lasiosphaeria miniovina]
MVSPSTLALGTVPPECSPPLLLEPASGLGAGSRPGAIPPRPACCCCCWNSRLARESSLQESMCMYACASVCKRVQTCACVCVACRSQDTRALSI